MSEDVAVRARRFERMRVALAEHNWLSVGIEIMIVTVGVLLAFEIEQWGQRQERAEEERQLLERLYSDNARNLAELKSVAESHRKAVNDLGTVLRNRADDALLRGFSARPTFGCGIATLPSAPYNDTSWQELVTSGRLGIVRDPELRTLIRDVAAVQQQGSVQLEYTRNVAMIIVPTVNRYYRYRLGDGPEQECRIQWPEVVKDQEAANSIARAYRMHRLMLEVREGLIADLLKLEASLACKLGKPECRR